MYHHKGGWGVLARFVKLAMRLSIQAEVFLDSDNVEGFDTLSAWSALRCRTMPPSSPACR